VQEAWFPKEVGGDMLYRTFSVGEKPDGNLELIMSEQELSGDLWSAQNDLIDQADWDGSVQGIPVVCVGAEMIVPTGDEKGWYVATRLTRDELAQNRKDENLGRLIGHPHVSTDPSA
jgi:hypothetical protein